MIEALQRRFPRHPSSSVPFTPVALSTGSSPHGTLLGPKEGERRRAGYPLPTAGLLPMLQSLGKPSVRATSGAIRRRWLSCDLIKMVRFFLFVVHTLISPHIPSSPSIETLFFSTAFQEGKFSARRGAAILFLVLGGKKYSTGTPSAIRLSRPLSNRRLPGRRRVAYSFV